MLEIAIIGAGPYGLSIAAYFRTLGVPYRIFGRPMDSWLAHMPKGMLLKSDGFASNICDPKGDFTLEKFCAERGIAYSHTDIPVSLETFSAYGLAFRERMLPALEDKQVVSLDRVPGGFRLGLDDGETFEARRVVAAVGITHFEYVPGELAKLPAEYLAHSARVRDVEAFRGRKVTVIGGGASATDVAYLLHDAGAEVQIVARQPELKFHTKSMGQKRSWWARIRHPQSGLGPGLRSRFFANSPLLFHYCSEGFRLNAVRTHLGPAGGYFARDKVIGRVPVLGGYTPQSAEVREGKVRLQLRGPDGSQREIVTQHVVAATGYKVDIERLKFLNAEIRSKLKTIEGAPVLNAGFESSVPGLYFVGIAAANSFGPVMRFAYGAGFAARHLTQVMAKSLSRHRASIPDGSVATIAE